MSDAKIKHDDMQSMTTCMSRSPTHRFPANDREALSAWQRVARVLSRTESASSHESELRP